MHGSLGALAELEAIAAAARKANNVDVAVCPPFTLIAPAASRGFGFAIGAQDCHAAAQGAHTGNLSAAMLREAGASLAILGHSERRADQCESDSMVAAKAAAVLEAGMMAIVCVGEGEGERAAGREIETVTAQLRGSLPEPASGAAELVIAYEPIWAIGTGRTATPTDVDVVHRAIRSVLGERLGAKGASIRILYGGSVKAENAAELFALPDVDGALVGGASLTAAAFVPIVEAGMG